MQITPRTFRLASALAVAAVSLAALSTVAANWLERRDAPQAVAPVAQIARPAADQPVHVVRAPREESACRGCAAAAQEKWL